jgi:RNA recognition motif-containing protein
MAKKLYVGNLPLDVTQEQLQQLFAQAGEVIGINMITDRETGQPRGFAFIDMANDASAQDAIKRYSGYVLDNRTLTVSEARPRGDRPSPVSYSNRSNRNGKRY